MSGIAMVVVLALQSAPVDVTPKQDAPVGIALDQPLKTLVADVEVVSTSTDGKRVKYLEKDGDMTFVVALGTYDPDWAASDEPVPFRAAAKEDEVVEWAGAPRSFTVTTAQLGGRDARGTLIVVTTEKEAWEFRPVGATEDGRVLYVNNAPKGPAGRLKAVLMDSKTGKAVTGAMNVAGRDFSLQIDKEVSKGQTRAVRLGKGGGDSSGRGSSGLKFKLETDGSALEFVAGSGVKYETLSPNSVTVKTQAGTDVLAYVKGKTEGRAEISGTAYVPRSKGQGR